MRESALPPSLLARGGVWADAIYAWHLARLRWDGLSLRAQDLFAPKTSSSPRPQSQQAHVTCVGCGAFIMPKTSSSPRPLRAQDLFEPKTSSSPRPLRGQNRPPGERFAFAWPTTRMREARYSLSKKVRNAQGAAFTWAQVCPFAWKEPRQYVERIERWRTRFGGKEYAFSPFMGPRGLVPLRGVGQKRLTSSWRKQEAGDGAALQASRLHGVNSECARWKREERDAEKEFLYWMRDELSYAKFRIQGGRWDV